MHQIQSKLADMKELVEQRAYHRYLARNIPRPNIDEDKLLILISIFDQLNLAEIESRTYITAASLMQMALDTHDHVQIYTTDEDLKRQQLTVLAGDYYSGLYYKSLSSINNIALIKELSEGIKEINEHKILIYEQCQLRNIGDVVVGVQKIESALIEKLARFFDVTIWNDYAINFLLVKRLLKEKTEIKATGSSLVFEAMKRALYPNCDKKETELSQDQSKQILQVFDNALNQAIVSMEAGRNKLPNLNGLLINRSQELVNENQTIANIFAEEG